MNIRPLYDRLVIQRHQEEEMTKGGILLPDNAKEKQILGTVVAIGEGKFDSNGKRMPLTVKVGNTVVFGKYAGNEVKIGSEEYVVMREDDIMGIIEE